MKSPNAGLLYNSLTKETYLARITLNLKFSTSTEQKAHVKACVGKWLLLIKN
jgi:hypothetical protein